MSVFRNFKYAVCVCLTLLITSGIFSQTDINFDRIGVGQGLSQNSINAIIQDHKGFMWFATQGGLNKFDGYSFTVYKNIKDDSTSLADNMVSSICQSKLTHNIWLGTNNSGLCCFDYKTEKFTSFKHNSTDDPIAFLSNTIANIVEDKKGNLWISYNIGGIGCFDPKTRSLKNYHINPNNTTEQGYGDAFLYFDSRDFLWVGTMKGLYKFDTNTEKFISYQHDSLNPTTLPTNLINSIYEDKNYCFWIGTEEGLIRFLPDENRHTHFRHYDKDPSSISANRVYTPLRDEFGQLWVGTIKGVNLFDDTNNRFTSLLNDPADLHSLSSNNISKLFLDDAGVLWVGTFEKGINKYDTHSKRFRHYKYSPAVPEGIPQKTVRSIYEDQYGILWAGFVNGGLVRLDRKNGTSERYEMDSNKPNSLPANTVTAICEDHSGALWVGTWESGIAKAIFKGHGRNRQIDYFEPYNHNPLDSFSLSYSTIQFIYQDATHRLWIGTAAGLDIYDRKNDRFKHFTHDVDNKNSLSNYSLQKAIVEENDTTFWVGTWSGLNKITMAQDFDSKFDKAGANINSLATFKHYFSQSNKENSLSDNRITALCLNIDNTLWVGSYGGGLDKMEFYHNDLLKLTNFNEQNGFSNNEVYCIFNDDKGNVWSSTNHGISEVSYETNQIWQFKECDGLQSNEFWWGAGYKGASGELFFGGNNGFNSFFPAQIEKNNYQAPTVNTDFRLFNIAQKPDGTILKTSISETEEIFLDWSNKVFSIEFSALHFSAPENIKYKYKLINFDERWIPTDYKNRRVTYTNLEPGEYEFCVMATNSDGVWNEDHHSLVINIEPPFWKTLWFRILFAVSAGSLVYLLFLTRVHRIKKQNEKLEIMVTERTKQIELQKEEITAQNEELVHQNTNQERYISILSHDLRGPVGNIVSMFDAILADWDDFDDTQKLEWINILQQGAITTIDLIDDTLKFVKRNKNKLEPRIKRKNLFVNIENILNTYTESAKSKEIELVATGDFNIEVQTDHEMLKHILMNFVSNAIKFTPNKNTIEIRGETTDNMLKISVKDQGIGIPKTKIQQMFEDAENFSRAGTQGEKSHGIGLKMSKQYAELIKAELSVESKENQGSTFSVKLPIRTEREDG